MKWRLRKRHPDEKARWVSETITGRVEYDIKTTYRRNDGKRERRYILTYYPPLLPVWRINPDGGFGWSSLRTAKKAAADHKRGGQNDHL